MRSTHIVLCPLLLAAVASGVQVPHHVLQHRRSSPHKIKESVGLPGSQNRENHLSGDSGWKYDFGRGTTGDLEHRPRAKYATGDTLNAVNEKDSVEKPLLEKAVFIFVDREDNQKPISFTEAAASNGEESLALSNLDHRGLRRTASPHDAVSSVPGSMNEGAFDDVTKLFRASVPNTVFSWKNKFSIGKLRLAGDSRNIAGDGPSQNGIGGTEREDQLLGAKPIVVRKDDDDGGGLPSGGSAEQDNSDDLRKLLRMRRGFIFVPGVKTIPEDLDMGSGRCRSFHRQSRGRVICRPVW